MRLANLETAQKLQELGFGYDLNEVIYDYGWFHGYRDKPIKIYREETIQFIPAPRLDDIASWLREKHKLHIAITIADGDVDYFHTTVEDTRSGKYDGNWIGSYRTYDEALEAGVNATLEMITHNN